MNINKINMFCKKCRLWERYSLNERTDKIDKRVNRKRKPNNCVKYLCNDGKCPHDR